MTFLRVVAFAGGVVLVVAVVLSAVRTFVVPRGIPVMLTRWVFVGSRRLFMLVARRADTYEERDRLMAVYAPLTLVMLPAVWLAIILTACTAMFWGLGVAPLREAFHFSGSSLLTLGFDRPPDLPTTALSFAEAIVGLGLLALLIAYLPTMYNAFSRREAQVAMMEVRAGSPPTPAQMLRRAWAIGWMDRLPGLWTDWEAWFIELEETHTSFPALNFFRSPQPDRSWVTAAGCILDTAAMRASVLDLPRESEAELCVRTGYVALRRVADYFSIAYDADPAPDDPISVTRDEFDGVLDELVDAGLPVKGDRDEAWRAWQGWRVNYDVVLITLAGLTMAPYAPWSSDRSIPYSRPPLVSSARLRRGGRRRSVGEP